MNDEVIVLSGSKKKAALMLVGSAAFVAMAALMAAEGRAIGWVGVIFFGLFFLLSLCMLTPGAIELRISKDGVEMKTLFKRAKLAWNDVAGFYIASVQIGNSSNKVIAIKYAPAYDQRRAGRQFGSDFVGVEGALPNHFSKPAEELCVLLNQSKQRWTRSAV